MKTSISTLALSAAVMTLGGYTTQALADDTAPAAPVAAPASASPASASPASASDVTEVVVTAERHKTRLLKTPISVTAVDQQAVQQSGLQQIRDLEGQVPGLATPGSIPNMQSSFLRGIGTSDAGAYQAVGIYVDDVYLPRVFGNALFDLPDLRQIEVLRGPQASLYGQNTTAGVIKFVTADPDDSFRFQADASAGNFNLRQAHILLSGPLIKDKLYASLAYGHRTQDGYIYDEALNRDVNRIETDQARGKLRFVPNSVYDATLSVDWAEDHSDNATFTPIDPVTNQPLYGSKRVNRADPVTSDHDLKLGRFSGGASLIQSVNAGQHLFLKSTTAWRYLTDDPSPWDYDGTPEPVRDFVQYIHENYYYQELQASWISDSFTVIGGVTAFREKFRFGRFAAAAKATLLAGTTGDDARNYTYTDLNSQIIDKNVAGYINATWHATPKLNVTLGLRSGTESQTYWNHTDQLKAITSAYDSLVLDHNVVNVAHAEDSWNSFTPKLSLDYQATPGLFTYVSYAEGQRTGGYDRNASANTAAAEAPTDPEKVKTVEAGFKWRTPAGRATTSFSLFHNDFQNYITSISNPVIDGVSITGALPVNAGKAHTEGFEFEQNVRVTDNFDLRLTGLIVNGKFDDFIIHTSTGDVNYGGKKIPFLTPQLFGLNLNYRVPLKDDADLRFDLDAKYVSPYYADIGNTAPYRIPQNTPLNASATWTLPGRHLSLEAHVINLTDAQPLIRRTGYTIRNINGDLSQSEDGASFAEPRKVFVTVRYRY